MRSSAVERLRTALKGLGEGGSVVSGAMIYKALGDPEPSERDRIRRRLNQMVKQGEIKRVKPGHYTCKDLDPRRDAPLAEALWRAIRTGGASFDVLEITRLSGATYNYAIKYVAFWVEAGYVVRAGRSGNATLYRLTDKGHAQRATPFMPRPPRDPYAEVRAAACRVTKLLMLNDPAKPKVRAQILAACNVITTELQPKEALDAQ